MLAGDADTAQSFFDPLPVRQKWSEHLAGTRNWQYQLWVVLMFQAWLGAATRSPSAPLRTEKLAIDG